MNAAADLPEFDPEEMTPLAGLHRQQVARHLQLKVGDLVAGRYQISRILQRNYSGTLLEAVAHDQSGLAFPRVTVHVLEDSAARDFSMMSRVGKLQGLSHPGLIGVRHVDVEQGALVLTSEFCAGETLEALLQRRQARVLERPVAVGILREAAEALLYMHKRGVAHGNLVPANILVTESGGIRLQGFELRRGFAAEVGRDRRAFARLAYLLLSGSPAPLEELAVARLPAPASASRLQWRAIRETLAAADGTRSDQVLTAFASPDTGAPEAHEIATRRRSALVVVVIAAVIVSAGGYLLLP